MDWEKEMTNKIDKLIEALIEDIDTKKLWRLCFNKMTNNAKRQMVNEMLNLILGPAYPTNGSIFSKTKDEINSIDKDVEEIDRLRIELEQAKAEEKYLKQCCQKAGEELAKHSFDYDGKEKNLVVQAIELNEKYEKLKKALEEIEEIVNKKTETSICSECAYNHISECKDNCMQDVLENILDIINEGRLQKH